jgi:type VI secretion system secreted protein VgrG
LNLGADDDPVGKLLRHSVPVQQQLDELTAGGWAIRYTDPKDASQSGSYTDYATSTIVIDRQTAGDTNQVAETITHELGHALYGDRSDWSSREAYIRSALANEGAATLNNIRMQRNIVWNGGSDVGIAGVETQRYDAIYNAYLGDGDLQKAIDAIGTVFGNLEHPSTAPNMTYAEFYGEWYDAQK